MEQCISMFTDDVSPLFSQLKVGCTPVNSSSVDLTVENLVNADEIKQYVSLGESEDTYIASFESTCQKVSQLLID